MEFTVTLKCTRVCPNHVSGVSVWPVVMAGGGWVGGGRTRGEEEGDRGGGGW